MTKQPIFHVWTHGKSLKGSWKLHTTTSSMQELEDTAVELSSNDFLLALAELGTFDHNGKTMLGQVTFWWSPELNDMMKGEPRGRGTGWSDDLDILVEYSYPSAADVAKFPALVPEVVAPDRVEDRYAEGTCDHCGKILSMNFLKRLEHQVVAGHSSGSTRVSRSNSTRNSGRSFSFGSSSGSSRSSGRTHFKREVLWLCSECYNEQHRSDRSIFNIIYRLLSW